MQYLTTQSKELKTEQSFCFDCEDIDEEMCVVSLCPDKLKSYWQEYNWYQRSPNVTSYKHGLPWDAEPKRLLSLVNIANAGACITPIRITKNSNGSLSFPDGRHRSVLAMINDHSVIKALIKRQDKHHILNLLTA
jgi:hypothetical protein